MHHTTFLDTLLTKIDAKTFENSYNRSAQIELSLLVNPGKLIQIFFQNFSSPGGKKHFLQSIFWKTHPFFCLNFHFPVIIYSWDRLVTGKFIHANSMRTGPIFVSLISGKLVQLWYLAWMSFPENSLCHVPKSFNQRLEAFFKILLRNDSILTKFFMDQFSINWANLIGPFHAVDFCSEFQGKPSTPNWFFVQEWRQSG